MKEKRDDKGETRDLLAVVSIRRRANHTRTNRREGHYNEIGFRLARSRAAFIKSAISSLPLVPLRSFPPSTRSREALNFFSFNIIHSPGEPFDSILRGGRRGEPVYCSHSRLFPLFRSAPISAELTMAATPSLPSRPADGLFRPSSRRLKGNKSVMHVKRLAVTRRIHSTSRPCIPCSRSGAFSIFIQSFLPSFLPP